MVLRQHLGAQHGHAGLIGRLDELGEQDGAEPVVLHGVGDGEGDLGTLGAVGFTLPAGRATTRPSSLLVATRP